MASLTQIAQKRKQSLRTLLKLSRRVNTTQEALAREVQRLVNRKKAVPEMRDMDRIIDLAASVNAAANDVAEGALVISRDWTNAG